MDERAGKKGGGEVFEAHRQDSLDRGYSATARPREGLSGSVAKLIQDADNSLWRLGKALPALPIVTYHKVQFGKVAFADPRQSCRRYG